MAKIPSTRLTKAPEQYQRNLFDLLFDDLRRIINLLNSTYLTDIENKTNTLIKNSQSSNFFIFQNCALRI